VRRRCLSREGQRPRVGPTSAIARERTDTPEAAERRAPVRSTGSGDVAEDKATSRHQDEHHEDRLRLCSLSRPFEDTAPVPAGGGPMTLLPSAGPPTSHGRFGLRQAVLVVALANLAYVFVEMGIAQRIGSVSLFADSVDFLEDAAVNFLIFAALGWTARRRARVGTILAGILLVPALAFLWTAWRKLMAPAAPEAWLLSVTGLGALAINLFCAFLLARFRHHAGSLTRAAFLSARNDAFANVAIIGAGLVTRSWRSGWPDLVVGLGIAVMNADAAGEVWRAARDERLASEGGAPQP